MSGPTRDFWQQRFDTNSTPWDRGAPSPQLALWLADGVLRANTRIVVPGCGAGHEVRALAEAGLRVTGLDYAPSAIERARATLAGSSAPVAVADLQCADVLQWRPQEPLDAVYEQTCLCALHPDLWIDYAAQLHAWLRPHGLLCALFMQARRDGADQGLVEGPPYHCDINAMHALFPATRWHWPKPPYDAVMHPRGWFELPVVLARR